MDTQRNTLEQTMEPGWLRLATRTMEQAGMVVLVDTQRKNTVCGQYVNYEETENALFVDPTCIYIENEAGLVSKYAPTMLNLVQALEKAKVNG